MREKNLNCICHSEKKKLSKNTDIYLVDTYGESKAFYSISNVVFLGGSFVPRGGQNPLEAVRFYSMLNKSKLSFEAKNFYELKKIIFNLITKSQNNKKKVNKFKKIGNKILTKNFEKIRVLI